MFFISLLFVIGFHLYAVLVVQVGRSAVLAAVDSTAIPVQFLHLQFEVVDGVAVGVLLLVEFVHLFRQGFALVLALLVEPFPLIRLTVYHLHFFELFVGLVKQQAPPAQCTCQSAHCRDYDVNPFHIIGCFFGLSVYGLHQSYAPCYDSGKRGYKGAHLPPIDAATLGGLGSESGCPHECRGYGYDIGYPPAYHAAP